jgi:hypothetical protein
MVLCDKMGARKQNDFEIWQSDVFATPGLSLAFTGSIAESGLNGTD